MSTVLYYSTIILCVSGVAYSLVYIWLNFFSRISDLEVRNASILKIIKASVILSIIFALLTCLLSNPENIGYAIGLTVKLYSMIARCWLFVILICGIAMLKALVSRTGFRGELQQALKNLFSKALGGAVFGILLAWLFS